MIKLFDTPSNSPIIYTLLVLYFIFSSITVFDTRLIQARRNGTIEASEEILPWWVSIIGWLEWLIVLGLLLLNWKVAIVAFVVKFILSVLPVLETVGNIIMSPFSTKKK